MFDLTYLGNACFAVETEDAAVLVDPFISENPECPYDVSEAVGLAEFDAVCVTHLAGDHVGDCLELSTEHGLPVVTEPATFEYLTRSGVPEERVVRMVWGQEARLGDLTIRALRAEHASTGHVDGQFLSGLPLSFLLSAGGRSVYHMGDTALFSDLALYGERYAPDAILIGVGQAYETDPGPDGIEKRIYELTTDEAVVATEWLDPEVAVPIHYVAGEREAYLEAVGAAGLDAEIAALDPGESLQI